MQIYKRGHLHTNKGEFALHSEERTRAKIACKWDGNQTFNLKDITSLKRLQDIILSISISRGFFWKQLDRS
jgi:hypothetical protein